MPFGTPDVLQPRDVSDALRGYLLRVRYGTVHTTCQPIISRNCFLPIHYQRCNDIKLSVRASRHMARRENAPAFPVKPELIRDFAYPKRYTLVADWILLDLPPRRIISLVDSLILGHRTYVGWQQELAFVPSQFAPSTG